MSDYSGPSKNVARSLRKRMTVTERYVWKELRNYKAHYYFRRQHRLAGYVLDFYCHRCRLCIEIDGEGHQKFRMKKDQERDTALADLGVLTMRFKNEEIATDWSGCLRRILFVCIDRDSGSDSERE